MSAPDRPGAAGPRHGPSPSEPPAAVAGTAVRFAPAGAGWPAFWSAAADALTPWLREAAAAGAPVAIVVPRGALVAPLRGALRARLATPGRPWAPPPIRPMAAWVDELAPAVPVDALARTLSLLEVLDAAMPDSLPRRAPADRLAFAGGLLEVLDAFAQAGAAGRLHDPALIAGVVEAFGSPIAAERLRDDLALLARVARATEGVGVDPVAQGIARTRRLAAAWAARGTRVAWLGWQLPEPIEALLLAELGACLPAGALLRLEPDWPAIGRAAPLIAAAWPELVGDDPPRPLRERRHRWRAAPSGPVPTLMHAADREREAQLGARWVHARLSVAIEAGRSPPRLAIVALDRWLARRVRALLERAGVLIDDREGWLLSTTVAATAAMGWLDAVAGDGYYDDLLGWLDSRFVRPPDDRALRRHVERRATAGGYLRGWTGLLADDGEAGAAPGAMRAMHALALRQARPQPLRAHLDVLEQALRWADAQRRLAADAAGRQLLSMLESLRRSADGDGHGRPLPLAEFRALLAMLLERHRFFGPIESPVELLTPVDAAGRDFDAVLVLGASEATLPAAPAPLPLVNEPLRAMLGLPTATSAARAQQRDLALLLALAEQAAVTCRTDPSDGTRPSPWIERLRAMLDDARLADDHDDPGTSRSIVAAPAASPALPFGPLPDRIAVSALERLVACPFRFLAQDGWRLREPDEPVDVPGVRERGELVHAILERFHREAHARGLAFAESGRDALRALLVRTTEVEVGRELGRGGGALGEIAEWRATLERYVDWAIDDAAGGWVWADGERPGSVEVRWRGPQGERTLRIEGRLDRLDDGPDGRRVVDYKLGDPQRLKRIAGAADQAAQLALYAWFAEADGEVAASGYLSLRRDGVKWVPLERPAAEVVAAWRDRLPGVLARIEAGEPIRASGSACEHCASRGLCRKGHWS
jgi:ATP-dependent helicase/nuclease subunit B